MPTFLPSSVVNSITDAWSSVVDSITDAQRDIRRPFYVRTSMNQIIAIIKTCTQPKSFRFEHGLADNYFSEIINALNSCKQPIELTFIDSAFNDDAAIKLTSVLENFNQPISLRFHGHEMGNDGIKAFAYTIKNFQHPITLDFRNNRGKKNQKQVYPEGIRALAEALQYSKAPVTLILQHNQISAISARAFTASLIKSSFDIYLDLSHNYITSDTAIEFAEALRRSDLSHKIDITENEIVHRGIAAFSSLLEIDADKSITFNFNHFLNNNDALYKNITAIANALSVAKRSVTFNFERNKLDDQCMTLLGNALLLCKQKITIQLNLNQNNISDIGVATLIDAAMKSQCIISRLDLIDNPIRDETISHLAGFLVTCDYPIALSVSAPHPISPQRIQQIARAIIARHHPTKLWVQKSNNQLAMGLAHAIANCQAELSLDLSWGEMRTTGLNKLAEAIQVCNHPLSLNLSNTKFDCNTNTLVQFGEALKVNKNKLILNLRGNNVSAEGQKILAEAFQLTKNITEIHLGEANIDALVLSNECETLLMTVDGYDYDASVQYPTEEQKDIVKALNSNNCPFGLRIYGLGDQIMSLCKQNDWRVRRNVGMTILALAPYRTPNGSDAERIDPASGKVVQRRGNPGLTHTPVTRILSFLYSAELDMIALTILAFSIRDDVFFERKQRLNRGFFSNVYSYFSSQERTASAAQDNHTLNGSTSNMFGQT